MVYLINEAYLALQIDKPPKLQDSSEKIGDAWHKLYSESDSDVLIKNKMLFHINLKPLTITVGTKMTLKVTSQGNFQNPPTLFFIV